MTTYETVMKSVKAGEPDASKMVKMISTGKMPPKKVSKKVSEDDLALIKAWIAGGAPEK